MASRPDFIILRHARPDVQPERPASEWPLAPEGWDAAQRLGERLRGFGPLRVVASAERKAIQTGEAIGGAVKVDDRFGEQGRGTVPFLPGDAFHDRVIAHFRQPEDRILGDEASAEAAARFDAALGDSLAGEDDALPVIVSHGRIVSAWIAAQATMPGGTQEAEMIWQGLRMPDAWLVSRTASGWMAVRIDAREER
ncbi:MAG: histidine phosphatase family protein [Thermomicrobiales bacterium]